MNHDMVPVEQLEQGLRTLTHNWRNLLNGINLQIISAGSAKDAEDLHSDLEAARQLIFSATGELASFSQKITQPRVFPISYPVEYFLDDLIEAMKKRMGLVAERLIWQLELGEGKVMVDFAYFSEALGEVIENSLRYLPIDARLVISVVNDLQTLKFSWNEQKDNLTSPEEWGKTPFLTTMRGNLGLGLYFARRVLQAHEGHLKFVFSTDTNLLQTSLELPLDIL